MTPRLALPKRFFWRLSPMNNIALLLSSTTNRLGKRAVCTSRTRLPAQLSFSTAPIILTNLNAADWHASKTALSRLVCLRSRHRPCLAQSPAVIPGRLLLEPFWAGANALRSSQVGWLPGLNDVRGVARSLRDSGRFAVSLRRSRVVPGATRFRRSDSLVPCRPACAVASSIW